MADMGPATAFLKLGAGIKGESTVQGMEDCVDILHWSWGFSNEGHGQRNQGLARGRVAVQDLMLVTEPDLALVDMMKSSMTGAAIDTAELKVQKSKGGDGSMMTYLRLFMNDVYMSSYSVGGGANDTPTITFGLHFRQVEYEYTQQNADGSEGTSASAVYNVAEASLT